MAQVTISPKAEEDLIALWLYRAQYDAKEATEFHLALKALLAKRADFPKAAQPCAPPLQGLHTFPFKNLRVIYRPRADGIHVIRVLWSSQELAENVDTGEAA